jgi:hypothetical protein
MEQLAFWLDPVDQRRAIGRDRPNHPRQVVLACPDCGATLSTSHRNTSVWCPSCRRYVRTGTPDRPTANRGAR